MWWAAEPTTTSDVRLAVIAAAGSVLTAAIPVLISKLRERGQSKSAPERSAAESMPSTAGRHHRESDGAALAARIDDSQSLLNRLIGDLQRRVEAAEAEVRQLRAEKDSLESVVYQQRWEIQNLRAQVQAMAARGM